MRDMTPELYWLVLTTAMTGTFWIPYVVNRVRELGSPSMRFNPPADPPPRAPWAERAFKAHSNAVENLAVFAPLALAVYLTGSETNLTAWACMVYFFARLAHYLIGVFGLPIPFRTLAFLIGFACQMILAANLISSA